MAGEGLDPGLAEVPFLEQSSPELDSGDSSIEMVGTLRLAEIADRITDGRALRRADNSSGRTATSRGSTSRRPIR